MLKFREWFEKEYGFWPHMPGETARDMHLRLAEGFGLYVEQYFEELEKGGGDDQH